MDAEMERLGVETLGITHRNNRYFVSLKHQESPRLGEFLFGEVMAEVCRAALGPDAVLFYEQYVVKAAERGMKFGWHQDSGYPPKGHPTPSTSPTFPVGARSMMSRSRTEPSRCCPTPRPGRARGLSTGKRKAPTTWTATSATSPA